MVISKIQCGVNNFGLVTKLSKYYQYLSWCYKNIHCWHGPYSFSFSSSPSTFTLRTICTYTCTTSSDWSSSLLIFSGYIPFDCLLAHLYYICSPPMPFPLYRYPSYYILSPIPYYRSMTSSPLTLTTSPVSDSVLHYPYHSFSL
jgi:hypothetical protein